MSLKDLKHNDTGTTQETSVVIHCIPDRHKTVAERVYRQVDNSPYDPLQGLEENRIAAHP